MPVRIFWECKNCLKTFEPYLNITKEGYVVCPHCKEKIKKVEIRRNNDD